MKHFKILWLNWRCWLNPEMGGAEVFTREVAELWAETGHEITLFTSEFPGCKKEEIADGINIVRSGGRLSVYHQAKKFYSKRFKKEGFDVVIDEINTVPFFAPKFVKNNEKVVALIHQLAREYWFYETPFPISYLGYHILENKWLKQYLSVPTVTVSESTRSDLAELGFKHIFVVPEGLNFEPLKAVPMKENKPIMVYVGRLKRAKRPDHAVKAFEIVKTKISGAELWILGDGPLKRRLRGMTDGNVRFFSGLGHAQRRDLIGRAWVLVNPGVREGWGLNIVEANALGTPTVAYDVPGLRDSVKDNETGLLAKAGNVEDLAEKTITLLKDVDLRRMLSKNALMYSAEFNWNKTAKYFMNIIEATFNER